MTVRVERAFDVAAPIDAVWEVLSDNEQRANAISVVERFEFDGDEVIWYLRLPIPLIDRTVAVRTRDVERDPPNRVKFTGKSKIMMVTGEHELTETESGCHVENRFVVDGKVPGVEKFFKRNFDDEIDNIKQSVLDSVTEVEDL